MIRTTLPHPSPHLPAPTASAELRGNRAPLEDAKSATEFAVDVATELTRIVPGTSDYLRRTFAKAVVGSDLRATFPSPHPDRRWKDVPAIDARVRETLEARVGTLSPYVASAETSTIGTLCRTKLAAIGLVFTPGTLSLPTRFFANLVVKRMAVSIGRTPMFVYTSSLAKCDFHAVRQAVRSAQTKPKGRILKALQAPLDEQAALMLQHGVEARIVAVSGLEHPTYIATTLAGSSAAEATANTTALALCKLDHSPSPHELLHLDRFARRMLEG